MFDSFEREFLDREEQEYFDGMNALFYDEMAHQDIDQYWSSWDTSDEYKEDDEDYE